MSFIGGLVTGKNKKDKHLLLKCKYTDLSIYSSVVVGSMLGSKLTGVTL